MHQRWWPSSGPLGEEAFDDLRSRASRLLMHPLIDQLLVHFERWIWPFWPSVHIPRLRSWLYALRGQPSPNGQDFVGASINDPLLVRQWQAYILLLVTHPIDLYRNVQVSMNGFQLDVHIEPFATACYRLGWALLLPRSPGWDDDEVSLQLHSCLLLCARHILREAASKTSALRRMLQVDATVSGRLLDKFRQPGMLSDIDMETFRRHVG